MRRLLKEALLALALLALGLFGLPPLVYLVGQLVIGEYETGLRGLFDAIADALASGNRYAWLMVSSPYLTVQILRFCWWCRRSRKPVS